MAETVLWRMVGNWVRFHYTFTDQANAPVDLTGAVVNLVMDPPNEELPSVVTPADVLDQSVPANKGKVLCLFKGINAAGLWSGQFKGTLPGPDAEPLNSPPFDYEAVPNRGRP